MNTKIASMIAAVIDSLSLLSSIYGQYQAVSIMAAMPAFHCSSTADIFGGHSSPQLYFGRWPFLDLSDPKSIAMTTLPNKSPEPTAVGAVSSAVAVHVASRRWLELLFVRRLRDTHESNIRHHRGCYSRECHSRRIIFASSTACRCFTGLLVHTGHHTTQSWQRFTSEPQNRIWLARCACRGYYYCTAHSHFHRSCTFTDYRTDWLGIDGYPAWTALS